MRGLLEGKVRGKRRYAPWKWAPLLLDPDVRLWYDTMEANSRAEARNYAGYLGGFLEAYAKGMSPKDYAALSAKEQADALQRAINDLTRKGKAGAYIDNIRKAVVRWLDHNGLKLQRKISIPKEARHRRRRMTSPEPEQLRAALGVATPRMKVALGLTALSGCRLEAVGNDYGVEARGLTFGDLDPKDVDVRKLHEGVVDFKVLPARLHIPQKLSKIGVPTFTFVGHQLAAYIRDSVVERRGFGERLGPESPLVAARARRGGFMTASALRKSMRRALLRADVHLNPNSLRHYFAHRAQLAGGDLQAWVDFFMNHTGTVYDQYARRGEFNRDVVEHARKTFEKVMAYVETVPQVTKGSELADMVAIMMRSYHYAPERIEAKKLPEKSREELLAIVDTLEPQRRKGTRPARMANGGGDPEPEEVGGPAQEIVAMEDLRAWIGRGWRYVDRLPDGTVVVERRGSED